MNDTILSRFTWDFPGGVTGLVLAAALGITLIVLSYAFTRTSLSPFRRMLFLILRLTAFAALLYCLCNPRMETRRSVSQTHSRKIAVLLDESGSMQKQNYWKRSRLQDAIRFLEENGIRNSPNREFHFYRFADTIRETESPAETTNGNNGKKTRLFPLIAEQVPRFATGQFDGILYLTDGIDTSGSDVSKAFSALAGSTMKHIFVPVTTAQTAPPSFRLRKIESPTLAFDGTEIPFTLLVQQVNPPKSSDLRLHLYRNRETVPFREIQLPAVNGIRTVKHRFAVKGSGSEFFKAQLLLNGKIVDEKVWFLQKEIRRATTSILVYNGALEYGNRFLKHLYLDDPAAKLEIVFAKDVLAAKEGTRRIDFSSQKELGAYDVIVLFNLNRRQITEQMEQGLREYVRSGGGLFFITGNPMIAAEFAASPLEKLLPVRFSGIGDGEKRYDVRTAAIVRLITARNRKPTNFDSALQRNSEMKYKPHPLHDFILTETGRESPIFRQKQNNGKLRPLIPRFEDFAYVESAKPAANVLAYHLDEKKRRHILLAYQNFGQGRSMVLATDPLWRWKLKLPSSDNSFQIFWKNLFSWLALGRNNQAAWQIPNHILSDTSDIELQLSTGGIDALPQDIICHLENSGRKQRLSLVEHNGKLSAHFRASPGIHTIRAEYQDKTIAEARFKVDPPSSARDEELADMTPAIETLEQFATLPNVELHPMEEPLDLDRYFPMEQLELTETSTLPLWHRFSLFALIAFCFGLELILRRSLGKLV